MTGPQLPSVFLMTFDQYETFRGHITVGSYGPDQAPASWEMYGLPLESYPTEEAVHRRFIELHIAGKTPTILTTQFPLL